MLLICPDGVDARALVDDDAVRIDLVGRHERDHGDLLGMCVQDVVGIDDAKGYRASGHALDDRRVRATAENFDLNAVFLVVAVDCGRVQAAVFGFWEPVERELDFGQGVGGGASFSAAQATSANRTAKSGYLNIMEILL